ncbi:hypothetical protein Syun_016948 [Stephania yunnanensis]|uniref:Uncharacterized protein n=1 Tax=Stephania yunnanensis TaxID=152371 RepID=A0AAP0J616_9MAGN
MELAPMFYFYGELRFLPALLPSTEMLPSHALPLEELMVLLPVRRQYATLLSII